MSLPRRAELAEHLSLYGGDMACFGPTARVPYAAPGRPVNVTCGVGLGQLSETGAFFAARTLDGAVTAPGSAGGRGVQRPGSPLAGAPLGPERA